MGSVWFCPTREGVARAPRLAKFSKAIPAGRFPGAGICPFFNVAPIVGEVALFTGVFKMKEVQTPSTGTVASFVAVGSMIGNMDGNHDAQVVELFIEELAKVATVETYKVIRASFIKGYLATRECSEKSAQNRWAELCRLSGFEKPQSDEAKAKAAQRAKSGARTPKADKADKAAPAGVEAALAGLAALADTIQRELIDAVMHKQWALVAQLADKAAELDVADSVPEANDE